MPNARTRSGDRAPRAAVVFGVSLLLSLFGMARVWAGGATRTVQIAGGDLATYVWGLRWVPFALVHGHSPFHSNWMNYPAGVNVLNNTGSILLAVVASPVTLAFGSTASFNVLTTLAFPVSAAAAYTLLRRWTSWWVAACAGALLYGFSPYMVSVGWAHLFLVFVPWLPLVVLCLDELLVHQQGSPRRWGVALGLVVIGQFFTSSEALLDTAELVAIGLLVLALLHRDEVVPRLRRALPGLLTGAGLAFVVLAYPAWYTLLGPQHVRVTVPARLYSADLVGPVVPGSNQLVTTPGLRHLGDRLTGFPILFGGHSYQLTAAAYLGLPLVAIVVLFAVRYRRVAVVSFFAFMAVVAFVASLGPRLKVAGHVTSVPLPGWVFEHVPFLEATWPYRYGLFVVLGAAVVLAVGLDRLHAELQSRRVPRPTAAGAAALGLAAVLLLLPAWPYTAMKVPTPEYFRSPAIAALPAGSVLVTYPFPGPASAETMMWQSRNDMHYRIVGGYTFVPDHSPKGWTLLANPSITRDLLDELLYDRPQTPLRPDLKARMLEELRSWRARTVVVVLDAPRAPAAVSLFTSVLGTPPRYGQGVAVWDGLPFATPS